MMNTSIVLTVIADDKPGVIKTVSSTLTSHGGSWIQSSMSSLAGQFAGILLVTVPADNTDAFLEALKDLESIGLRVIAHIGNGEPAAEVTNEYVLDLVGNDRAGIVRDITTVLASYDVNVHDFETVVEGASMAGGEIFRARAKLIVPVTTDTDALTDELEDMANDLMVDISFDK